MFYCGFYNVFPVPYIVLVSEIVVIYNGNQI